MGKKHKTKRKPSGTAVRNGDTQAVPTHQRRSVSAPYPYAKRMNKKLYEETLERLQIELLKVQTWAKDAGKKVVILFEGRDAAGKGSTIKRFTEHLNPRGARVIALEKPDETQKGQWYFQRYVAHLPTRGELVFFDRSWYNRAGVEPVMGFCTPDDYQRFIHQVAPFERAIIESGTHLVKFWFDVGQEEQRKRIESRRDDPLKHWKLSPMDFESIARWDQYTRARDTMLLFTNTTEAPWTVIRSDDKRRARVNALLAVLHPLDYKDKDHDIVTAPDPLIVGPADEMVPMQRRALFDVD